MATACRRRLRVMGNVLDGSDNLDRLPDEIILHIFNQMSDAKALGRCSAVSRRFHALVPLVHNVVIGIDCIIGALRFPGSKPRGRGVLSHLGRFLLGRIHALTQFLGPNSKRPFDSPSSSSVPEIIHHSPAKVLHNFRQICSLRIGLPAGEIPVDSGVLLKWKATFGSSLESCVIICASSPKASDLRPEALYTDGSLKLKAFWTVVSLIAASARHYILQPIVADRCNSLQSLDFTDADGQGVLTMDQRQLQGLLQAPPVSASCPLQRTLLPALKWRLWYAPRLVLPVGIVLERVTLVAVRPRKEWTGGPMDWICNAFEEPYRAAARMLLKRASYRDLQSNSF